MAAGKKTGGRKKGSLNKLTLALGRQSDPLVSKANERIQQILDGKLPCSVCRGKGRTPYQPAKGESKLLDRTCQSCYGSKLEQLAPELIAKVALEVREYGYPKRKAIEVSGGPDGEPIQARVIVEYVDISTQVRQS